jgi:hypothetical protein
MTTFSSLRGSAMIAVPFTSRGTSSNWPPLSTLQLRAVVRVVQQRRACRSVAIHRIEDRRPVTARS